MSRLINGTQTARISSPETVLATTVLATAGDDEVTALAAGALDKILSDADIFAREAALLAAFSDWCPKLIAIVIAIATASRQAHAKMLCLLKSLITINIIPF